MVLIACSIWDLNYLNLYECIPVLNIMIVFITTSKVPNQCTSWTSYQCLIYQLSMFALPARRANISVTMDETHTHNTYLGINCFRNTSFSFLYKPSNQDKIIKTNYSKSDNIHWISARIQHNALQLSSCGVYPFLSVDITN